MSALAQAAKGKPLFNAEGPALYRAAFAHNAAFAKPGPYATPLHPAQEIAFNQWLRGNQIPFNPAAPTSDYDMAGYWRATGGAGHQPGGHFPDTFKTPYDTSFSNQSQYAKPGTPFAWRGNQLIDTRSGQIIYGQAGK